MGDTENVIRFHHICMMVAACAVLGLGVLAALEHGPVTSAQPDTERAHLRRVIDGDTVVLGFPIERVRLLGIDCPELTTVAGQGVKTELIEYLHRTPGLLRIERHGKDRYGRTLAYLFIGDQDVGLEMLQWCTEVSDRYPHPRQDTYKKAKQ